MSTQVPGSIDIEELIQSKEQEAEVGRRTLEATAMKAFTLINGVAREKEIRAKMYAHGFDDAVVKEGWGHLLVVGGYGQKMNVPPDVNDQAVRAASAQLDEMDEKVFRIIRASLENRFPAQAAFALDGLAAVRGPSAALQLDILCARLDALEAGREGSAEQDQQAIALLEKRGVSRELRSRIRGLVEHVKPVMTPAPEDTTAEEMREKERTKALVELRKWYVEWSEIARSVITRRDELIRLGLASPRRSEEEEEPVVQGPVLPPVTT